MLTPLLMLADSRLPAGGHAHSGSLEPAAAVGLLPNEEALRTFLAGRLSTAGLTSAGLARVACEVADCRDTVVAQPGRKAQNPSGLPASGTAQPPERSSALHPGSTTTHACPPEGFSALRPGSTTTHAETIRKDADWSSLDVEADARTPSPAQRATSRRQGRTLLRAGRTAWPAPYLDDLAGTPGGPHHPIVLGAVAASAGCTPREAALAAAYLSVSGPAAAAVRLLGLDPLAVNAELARLAPRVEEIADAAVREYLPCPSAPGLDLLAEAHARSEARLFES